MENIRSFRTSLSLLKLLAEQKEYQQYKMPDKLDVSYRTVLRHLKNLEDQDLLEVARTEPSEKGGKDRKIYTLTQKGVFVYLAFASSWDKLGSIVRNYPDACLVFKKWGLFREAGIEEKMLKYLKEAIKPQTWFWRRYIFYRTISKRDFEETVKDGIDGLLYAVISFEHDEDLAGVCKEDEELREYVDGEFKKWDDGIKRMLEDKEWWENFQAA